MSRVVLKISGEALSSKEKLVNEEKLEIVLNTVKLLQEEGHLVAIVIGGGNVFRGRDNKEIETVTGDTIGMMGSIMNSLYIKDYLMKNNINCLISTPFDIADLIPSINKENLLNKYEDNTVIIFGAGLGKSGYSTDSGVILADDVLNFDLVIKLTNVDGVYSSDPKIDINATMLNKISFKDALENNYKIMDEYALIECVKRKIKILVINLNKYTEIKNYFNGKFYGTLIGD